MMLTILSLIVACHLNMNKNFILSLLFVYIIVDSLRVWNIAPQGVLRSEIERMYRERVILVRIVL